MPEPKAPPEIRAFQEAWLSAVRGPLDLEIGCGVGWHPITYALAHPERHLIAIEHTRDKFKSFASRLEGHRRRNQPLNNLLPVHADAVSWVTHRLKPASIDRVFFLYPNPNPKKRDRGKRWYAMPFITRVLDVLRPGGELILATNEKFYFDEAVESFRSMNQISSVKTRQYSQVAQVPGTQALPLGIPRTHFEKKYLARGETCFELSAIRV